MNIGILGGGPGGLYAGILLKKDDPSREITVFERNPPDATFGWGVVFSDRTLDSLREADQPTQEAIADSFAKWDAIDVWHRGETIRAYGHAFAGISRKVLLNILQRRCRELGVSLTFQTEIADLAHFDGYDLVIAADGVNSLARKIYAEVFRPSLTTRPSRYVWLGSHFRPDGFTYIVKETEHGSFLGQVYPFAEDMSTFIVECHQDTWKRAGLDEASESDTIAFCERVFAEQLNGHSLLSNRSLWLSFVTVRNATWHHRNVVLLGDAAHTAHYSVGSGTKMAMEDAIALAEAFRLHDSFEAAVTYYERAREPVVEGIQQAARESYTYFENIDRYARMEPMQFTFNLLTRSGRITYDNLRARDPRFLDSADRWYARRTLALPVEPIIAPPPMFTPFKLRGVSLTNRVILSPAGTFTAQDGCPGDGHLRQIERRAAGGAGLVMTELTAVSAEGRITPGDTGMYDDRQLEAWKRIVDAVHSVAPAGIALRLGHAGPRGSTRPRGEGLDRPLRSGNWPLLSATDRPYARGGQVPQAMTRADMERVRDEFARATRMAAAGCFDVLVLHVAQGYLLASFISPLTNTRDDEYGGTLENRMRFPLEVFDAVRAEWPEDRPVAVALTVTDWARRGTEIADAVAAARMLKQHGCDAIEVFAGQTVPQFEPAYGPFFLAPFADRIRNEAGIATIARGNITTPDQINTLLASGRADLCVLDPVVDMDEG
jgi:anthraniloyl-CoA monooxygenase